MKEIVDITFSVSDREFPLEDVIRLIRDKSLMGTARSGELSIHFRRDGADKLFYTLTASVTNPKGLIGELLKKVE